MVPNLQGLKLNDAAASGEFKCPCCSSFGNSNVFNGNLAKNMPNGEGCESFEQDGETEKNGLRQGSAKLKLTLEQCSLGLKRAEADE